MNHDPQAYVRCMEEIKARVAIADQAIASWRKDGAVSIPNVELAALQIRKVYELITFASLGGQPRKLYRGVGEIGERSGGWTKSSGDLRGGNPEFLPVAVDELLDPAPGVKLHLTKRPPLRLDADELVRRHGRLGEILHARNPFAKDLEYTIVRSPFGGRARSNRWLG